jgi:Rps23 Pro-64 3,4-dihydroxylase Tpa1-like proline 4-hydroxylase
MSGPLRFPETEHLTALAQVRSASYRAAEPFPHVVLDDFLSQETALALLAEFPRPDAIEWRASYADERQLKLACDDEALMGPVTRQILGYLNSGAFLVFLETLTGIDGLIPDPHFRGGGLHQIRPGGFLKVHADFNWYDRLRLDRRLNLLLYLNEDWEDAYGGHLELWDAGMTTCQRRILPVFNRCVIFSTTDASYHGHPDPLRCPPGRTRKSLALYYYSNGRPEAERAAPHSTAFRNRPTDQDAPPADVADALRRMRLRRSLRRFVPPIIWEALATLRRGR